jgi:hypothetical protein
MCKVELRLASYMERALLLRHNSRERQLHRCPAAKEVDSDPNKLVSGVDFVNLSNHIFERPGNDVDLLTDVPLVIILKRLHLNTYS